jgi:hypothetical protein
MNYDDHPNIEATGKFTAVRRFVYAPDGKWCGTPRSISASARLVKALEYLRTTDDVSYIIIEQGMREMFQKRHYPR